MDKPTGKMEFFYQYDEYTGSVTMTLSPGTPLPQVLEAFEKFLLASGYVFDGIVDIVDEVSVPQDPNAEQN